MDGKIRLIELTLVSKLSKGNGKQNTWVSNIWLKYKYIYRAHKAGDCRHFETVGKNAKFSGSLV